MHARVTVSETPVDNVDLAERLIKEEIIPTVKGTPGFVGGYWLGDRSTGKGVTITLWESEDALKGAEEAAKQVRSDAAAKLSLAINSIDRYEVIGHA